MSTDKEFSKKSADIIGLYLNPPQNALVICIDEKPSIQAIERKRGYVETSSGKIVQGMKSTYKRHGTLNLFAALNVATGVIQTQTAYSDESGGSFRPMAGGGGGVASDAGGLFRRMPGDHSNSWRGLAPMDRGATSQTVRNNLASTGH